MTPPAKRIRTPAPNQDPPTSISLPPSGGLYRSSHVPAGPWSFLAFSPPLFPRMLGPVPRLAWWCMHAFLPIRHRPSPLPQWIGTWHALLQNDFRQACVVEAADLSCCAGLRVCSPPLSFRPEGIASTPGRHGLYVHASLSCLPPRAVDMLTVRIEALTVAGLAPSKSGGLASRS